MSRNDIWQNRNLGRLGLSLAFIMLVTSIGMVDTLAEEMIDVPAPGIEEEEMIDVPAPGIEEIAEVPSPTYIASSTSSNASVSGSPAQSITGSSVGTSGNASSANTNGNAVSNASTYARGTGSTESVAYTSGSDTAETGTYATVKLAGTKVITRAKDKKKVTITIPESESPDARFVLNINTGAYHVQHGICSSELAMKEAHRIYTNADSYTIEKWNYLPCDRCGPGSNSSVPTTVGGNTQSSEKANSVQTVQTPATDSQRSSAGSSNNTVTIIEDTKPVSELQKQEVMVWLSKTGKRYHSRSNCGNMKSANAKLVTLSEAIAKGKTRCPNCKW